jgi:hypothetical protein
MNSKMLIAEDCTLNIHSYKYGRCCLYYHDMNEEIRMNLCDIGHCIVCHIIHFNLFKKYDNNNNYFRKQKLNNFI